jgi:hypothetical protein
MSETSTLIGYQGRTISRQRTGPHTNPGRNLDARACSAPRNCSSVSRNTRLSAHPRRGGRACVDKLAGPISQSKISPRNPPRNVIE